MENMTAVEWLIERLEDVDLTEEMFEGIKQQAKQMEREQIIDAYHINPNKSKWGNIGADYYTETFKK